MPIVQYGTRYAVPIFLRVNARGFLWIFDDAPALDSLVHLLASGTHRATD